MTILLDRAADGGGIARRARPSFRENGSNNTSGPVETLDHTAPLSRPAQAGGHQTAALTASLVNIIRRDRRYGGTPSAPYAGPSARGLRGAARRPRIFLNSSRLPWRGCAFRDVNTTWRYYCVPSGSAPRVV